jgi:hypothetical protein
LQVLAAFILTVSAYAGLSWIDYSMGWYWPFRIVLAGVSLLYFRQLIYSLATYLKSKTGKNEPESERPEWYLFVLPCALFLALMIRGTEQMNLYLLSLNHKTTEADVMGCHQRKSIEYCVYTYTVNGRYYEVQFQNNHNNVVTGIYGTLTIEYLPMNPAVSRIVTGTTHQD